MRAINPVFASVIAFGVVYNTARIALQEARADLLRQAGLKAAESSTVAATR